MTLDEKALEIAAKRLCMEAMGGDNEQNHSRIALAWGMRADRYRNEAQAAITAYLSALSEKGEQLMPRTPPLAVIKYVAEELDDVSYANVEQVANKLFEALHFMPVKT